VEHWLFGLSVCPHRSSTPTRDVRKHGSLREERRCGGRAGLARCWVLRERPLVGPTSQDRLHCRDRQVRRDRPYLENCTVDASITSVVAKLLRAHGGCLGTRSR
jgi:hypothetical protein